MQNGPHAGVPNLGMNVSGRWGHFFCSGQEGHGFRRDKKRLARVVITESITSPGSDVLGRQGPTSTARIFWMVVFNNVPLVERSVPRQNNVKRFSSGAITVLSDVPNWRCVLDIV